MKEIIYRCSILLCLVFSLFLIASAQNKNRSAMLAEVVAAENSFADRAFEGGTRAAFIEFSADNGLVFNQKPENAREVWQKRPANNSLLVWRPAWADVSADGALGYTTGAWAFSRAKTDAPTAWGEYFTIWKKQSDDSWKFLLDLGIGHDKSDVVADSWKSPEIEGKTKSFKATPEIWKTLETSFSELLIKKGAKKAYEKYASEQIRLLREGQMPFQGKSSALTQITETPVKMTVLDGGASSDFAYAYGEFEAKPNGEAIEKGFYARIWKHESKGWRITAEVVHLLPEK